ncbi:MAG: hypothetical protein II855_08205 [Candidatus Methanomethylophilaceae archaeon]|nr:hypothetical protein [Candidatus Methanomethylophilaceae archaeon]
MNRSELKVQIILSSGKFLYVTEKARDVLDNIRRGKDQFIEMQCTDGFRHYINVDHIVEAKEAKEEYR